MSAPDKYLVWFEYYPEEGGLVVLAHSVDEARARARTPMGVEDDDDFEELTAKKLRPREWRAWRRSVRAESPSMREVFL